MDKMRMETADMVEQNAKCFPLMCWRATRPMNLHG